jgi:hypothetical protein
MGADGPQDGRKALITPGIVEVEADSFICEFGQSVEVRADTGSVAHIKDERMLQ